jgi:hypothetical protein
MPNCLKAIKILLSTSWRKYSSFESSPWCAKYGGFKFPIKTLYPIQSIELNGISESGKDFSRNGKSGEDGMPVLIIREPSGKNSRLT